MLLMLLMLVPHLRNFCSRGHLEGRGLKCQSLGTDVIVSQCLIPTSTNIKHHMANSGLLLVPVAGSVFLLRCLEGFPSVNSIIFPKAIDALVEFFGNSSYWLFPFSQCSWGLGQEAGLVHTRRVVLAFLCISHPHLTIPGAGRRKRQPFPI